MNRHEVGIDIIEISRFKRFTKARKHRFLSMHFTKRELAYCFSFREAAPHLAGIFAAKEAAFKALGRNDMLFSVIEIKRTKNNRPTAWFNKRLLKSISVSISHTRQLAIAVAIHS